MGIKLLFFLPFIEIISFIFFGDILGFAYTLLLILVSGILGLWLFLPNRNLRTLSSISRDPKEWLIRRMCGILLIIPGFCTDLIGVLLLVPASRKLLLSFGFQYFLERVYTFHSQNKQNFDDPNDTIIEGDFKSRSYSEDTDKTKPLT